MHNYRDFAHRNCFKTLSESPVLRGYVTAWLGRALEWHSRGQRFDPDYLHQKVREKACFREKASFFFRFRKFKKIRMVLLPCTPPFMRLHQLYPHAETLILEKGGILFISLFFRIVTILIIRLDTSIWGAGPFVISGEHFRAYTGLGASCHKIIETEGGEIP